MGAERDDSKDDDEDDDKDDDECDDEDDVDYLSLPFLCLPLASVGSAPPSFEIQISPP